MVSKHQKGKLETESDDINANEIFWWDYDVSGNHVPSPLQNIVIIVDRYIRSRSRDGLLVIAVKLAQIYGWMLVLFEEPRY